MTMNSVENINAEIRKTESSAEDGEELVIPVIREQVIVDKKVVETGKVRISKRISEHEELIDVPVMQGEAAIQRVPVNQFVESAPAVRYEGDTMIIPVIQEQVVLQKKLLLVEEIHVTKQMVETHRSQKVTLLREEVEITRIAGNENPDNSNIGD